MTTMPYPPTGAGEHIVRSSTDTSGHPPPRRTGLSKSRVALFEQCPKRLWLSVNRPEHSQESDSTRHVFRVGHEVGAVACAEYPEGIEIDGTQGMAHAAELTAAALAADDRVPIFEATFIHDGVAVRVDLMIPDGEGWRVAEVKSTTSVKPYQRADLATQLWVLNGCGVNVTRASVRVLDRTFVLRSPGDFAGLFVDDEDDEAVALLVDTRGQIISDAKTTLSGDEPKLGPGPHCTDPFPCSFIEYCHRHLPPPPEWPVELLPGVAGKRVARSLAERGVTDLLMVEQGTIAVPMLQRVHNATVSGTAWHGVTAIRRETDVWAYPRTFLDFESIGFAVPRWPGTRPYQQVPFQFSAHVDLGDGKLEQTGFLSMDGDDPRPACAQALAMLPDTGSVIAWNASFERTCLWQLAQIVTEHSAALRSLADRLVDLLPVARRHYYHRDMRGSWSIKAVLPTLAPELSYDQLQGARSGLEAQDVYIEALNPETNDQRRAEIRQGLVEYCARDTLAMAVLLERLQGPGCEVDDAADDATPPE